jgi:hypothetical protein
MNLPELWGLPSFPTAPTFNALTEMYLRFEHSSARHYLDVFLSFLLLLLPFFSFSIGHRLGEGSRHRTL